MGNLRRLETEHNREKKAKAFSDVSKRGYETSIEKYILVLLREILTVAIGSCADFRKITKLLKWCKFLFGGILNSLYEKFEK